MKTASFIYHFKVKERSMLRPLMKIAALLIVLFIVSMGAVMNIAYTQGQQRLEEIRAFLTPPEGCSAPCFMGIRPGVTTLNDVRQILEGNEWVEQIEMEIGRGYADEITYINLNWVWSGLQPKFINGQIKGYVTWTPQTGRIENISISANIRFYDLYTVLGQTEFGSAFYNNFAYTIPHIIYSASYFDAASNTIAGIDTSIACPGTFPYFWKEHAEYGISSRTGRGTFTPFYQLDEICANPPQ